MVTSDSEKLWKGGEQEETGEKLSKMYDLEKIGVILDKEFEKL